MKQVSGFICVALTAVLFTIGCSGSSNSNRSNLPAAINVNLSALVLSNGTLSPSFDKDTTTYAAEVAYDVTSIAITPTASADTSTIAVNGLSVISGSASQSISLPNTGSSINTISIIVTGEDNTSTKTYIVNVTRTAGSSNANLASLGLSEGTLSPTFDPATTSYTVEVPYTTSVIAVTPTVAGVNAVISVNGSTITSGYASQNIILSNTGSAGNAISIIVIAQDGTKKTYTVNVTRVMISSNANLSGLTVSSGVLSPSLAADTTSYTLLLSYQVSTLVLTPTASSPYASITVNGSSVVSGNVSPVISLSVGSNAVTIIVTAQDGTVKTYSITASRNNAVSTLSSLKISSGTLSPEFSSGTTSYNAICNSSVTSITVTLSSTDEFAAITVNGSSVSSGSTSAIIPVTDGTIITINVTGLDGTVKTYTITVSLPGVLWAKTSNTGSRQVYFQAISVDSNNNIYAAGLLYGTGGSSFNSVTAKGTYSKWNAILVKFDTQGTALWARTVSAGDKSSEFKSVVVDSGGNIYVGGDIEGTGTYTFGSVSLNGTSSSGTNAMIVKYTSDGDVLWAKTVSEGNSYSSFEGLTLNPSGDSIYASGYIFGLNSYTFGSKTITPTSAVNGVLVKYGIDGTVSWAKTVTNGTATSDFISVKTDSYGNVYVAGKIGGSVNMFDSVSVGGTYDGGSNALIMKYSPDGTAIWAKSVSTGDSYSEFSSIAVDSNDNLYTSGNIYSSGTYTFDSLSVNGPCATAWNVVLVKYSSDGTAVWAKTVTAGGNNSIYRAVTVDKNDNIYASGYLYGSGAYTFGSVTVNGVSSANYSGMLVQYTTGGDAKYIRAPSAGVGTSDFFALATDSSCNIYVAGYIFAGIYTFGTSSVTGATSSFNPVLIKYLP